MTNPSESHPHRKLGYATNGQSVLVFEKLIKVLERRQQIANSQTDDGIERQGPSVLEMMQESTVTPATAVQQWGMSHPSYYIDSNNPQEIVIRHTNLDCQIPVIFNELEQAQTALAELIMGRIIPADGDFIYYGQPLQITESSETQCRTRKAANVLPAPIIH